MLNTGTPLIRLKRWAPKHPVYAKLDYLFPSGSCYDRAGSELHGEDGLFIAGSAPFVLASMARAARAGRGFQVVVPRDLIWEHKSLLVAANAKMHLSPAEDGPEGAEALGRELAGAADAEVLCEGDAHDDLQASWFLDWKDHATQLPSRVIRLVGPACPGFSACVAAAREAGFEVEVHTTIRGPEGAAQRGTRLSSIASSQVQVPDRDAHQARAALAKTEGLLVGYSSAAAVSAAQQTPSSQQLTIIMIFDAGDRYFSVDHTYEAH